MGGHMINKKRYISASATLTGWWLMIRDLTIHRVKWQFNHVVGWCQVKNEKHPFVQSLWQRNKAGWWFTIRVRESQNHMTLWSHGQGRLRGKLRNFISTFSRPMTTKFGRGWLLTRSYILHKDVSFVVMWIHPQILKASLSLDRKVMWGDSSNKKW